MIQLSPEAPSNMLSIPVLMDVVDAHIPTLLGLDVLDVYSLVAGNITNRLLHRLVTKDRQLEVVDLWSVPHQGIVSRMNAKMFVHAHTVYTKRQRQKLQEQFAHPSATTLYDLLKTVEEKAVTLDTFRTLEEIPAICEPCQKIRNSPARNLRFYGLIACATQLDTVY